jgi:hypothetical protein
MSRQVLKMHQAHHDGHQLRQMHLPYGICIEVDPLGHGARLSGSRLRWELSESEDDEHARVAADALESLLLALAAAGLPLDTPEAVQAVESAVEAIAQQL